MCLETLSWICHICGKDRPDNKIEVRSIDVSDQYKLPKGTMKNNVRYCNDNPDCIEKSKTFRFGKET